MIINPIAGPGRSRMIGACVDLAMTVLAAQGVTATVMITAGADDAQRFAREAVTAGMDVVIAWGGDGTVNGAASALAGTAIPLGIIPGGSGNGLARDLSIPLKARAALEVAAAGNERVIDAGELHGHLFFNVAGIGFDAAIADRLAAPGARRGLLGYVVATLAEMRVHQAGVYSIHGAHDVDGKARMPDLINRSAMLIALANSRQYGNGAQIAPAARLDDGMIEIVVVEPQSALSVLRRMPALFQGTLCESAGVLMRSAASVHISSSHAIRFHVDGEPRQGPQSIRLHTRRDVLRVRVPR